MACTMRAAVFEGERAYGGEIFKLTRAYRAAARVGAHPRLQDSLSASTRSTTPAASCSKKQGFADAYVRPIAWRGSEMMGVSAQNNRINCRHRRLGVAELFRSGAEAEGHPPRHRRISPARPAHRAVASQGRRPLHDLHALQARGRGQGLCRCADARLARPGRRSDRRQRVLRQGRRDPYADAGLLPRRHHPATVDRARQQARLRGRSSARSCRRSWQASSSAS